MQAPAKTPAKSSKRSKAKQIPFAAAQGEEEEQEDPAAPITAAPAIIMEEEEEEIFLVKVSRGGEALGLFLLTLPKFLKTSLMYSHV